MIIILNISQIVQKTFSKMDTYCLMKQRFGLENFKRDLNIRADRTMLTKTRISNHILAVETGRFSKIPRNERLCEFCKAESLRNREIDCSQSSLFF